MTHRLFNVLAVGAGLVLATVPVLAHHSFAAEYDSTKPLKITGTVTKVEWMNPHIYYYVDVKSDDGKVTNFAVEGGTPGALYRQGWRKDSLKVGDRVTVEGFSAKDGSNHLNGRKVLLPDGSRVFGGSAEDGGPGTDDYGKSGKSK
jgi:hypothetical protein